MNGRLDREGTRIGYLVFDWAVRGIRRYSALPPVSRFVVVVGVMILLGLAVKFGILPSGMGRELAPASAAH